MKRILFVDDEPNVLAGIRRIAHARRADWDASFVTSGTAALAAMTERPVDVVVSDMTMPGMTGAELLATVKERYPETIRIILSGNAEQDVVMRSLLSAHQYLAKPCEPEVLARAVDQALALRARLGGARVRSIVSQLRALPSVPALYRELMRELSSPEGSLSRVADVIARDVGMSAGILRVVNSAYFGLARPIPTVQNAVTFLGTETIRTLVLSLHVFEEAKCKHIPGYSIEALWSRSLRTALSARIIAQTESAPPSAQDDAFVGGFFHDIGQLVLADNLCTTYGPVLEQARDTGRPVSEVEQEVIGAGHADVGAYLLALWGMPDPIVEAVALHETPLDSTEQRATARGAVRVASLLATSPDSAPPSALVAEIHALGLAERLEIWDTRTREVRTVEPVA